MFDINVAAITVALVADASSILIFRLSVLHSGIIKIIGDLALNAKLKARESLKTTANIADGYKLRMDARLCTNLLAQINVWECSPAKIIIGDMAHFRKGIAVTMPHAISFFSEFKAELMAKGVFEDLEQARLVSFSFIEDYCHRVRWYSSPGYKIPNEFELELRTKYEGEKTVFRLKILIATVLRKLPIQPVVLSQNSYKIN